MKKQICYAIMPLLIASSIHVANAATEDNERLAIQQPIIEMVYKKQWNKLDQIFKEYNAGFPATSNGTQKIVVAYGAIYETYGQGGENLQEIAQEWLKANPDSTAAVIIETMSYDGKATFVRGEGSASTVDEDAWPKYQKINEAKKAWLLKHKEVAAKEASWYQDMILTARNLNDKALIMQMLEEGSNTFPDYQNIYIQAMEALLPKWGGSPEEVEKVARIAVKKTADKYGKSYYAYLWYNALQFQPEMMDLLYEHKLISWDDMKSGWHDRYKKYPGDHIANEYMTTACLASDKMAYQEGSAWVKSHSGDHSRQAWLRNMDYVKCDNYFESKK